MQLINADCLEGSKDLPDNSVDAVVTDFFTELSSNQEPLGVEFEKVLFDNLWDLYVE